MAIYDKSQITKTESQCDSLTNLVDKLSCYNDVLVQYQEIVKANQDALNGTGSGSYAILKQFKAQLAACSPLDTTCLLSASNNIANTQSEIAVREARFNGGNADIKALNAKIAALKTDPKYSQDVKGATLKRTIYWGIGIVVIIILIIVAVHLYRKYKQG